MSKSEKYNKHVEDFELIVSNIADLISAKRNASKISLRTICKDTGISLGLLSEIEKHKKVPKFETMITLAMYLNIDLSEIFSKNLYTNKQDVEEYLKEMDKEDSYKHGEMLDKFNVIEKVLVFFHYSREQIKQIINYIRYIDYLKYGNNKESQQTIQEQNNDKK